MNQILNPSFGPPRGNKKSMVSPMDDSFPDWSKRLTSLERTLQRSFATKFTHPIFCIADADDFQYLNYVTLLPTINAIARKKFIHQAGIEYQKLQIDRMNLSVRTH